MELIFGGAYQGKLAYWKKNSGLTEKEIGFCSLENPCLPDEKAAVCGLHLYILAAMRAGKDPLEEIQNRFCKEQKITVLCDDLSACLVPMDPEQRRWRELTGKALQYLAKESSRVTRVFCGIGSVLKDE